MPTGVEYGFYRASEFLSLPRDPETWLIQPLVPVGGWVNVYGKPKKARKSYFALGMAWAVSSGQLEWLGFAVRRNGPVLYLQADTPHTLWTQRIEHIEAAGYDFSNVWFASLLTIPYPFNIAEHEDILAGMIDDARQEAVKHLKAHPVLIIYDTGRKLHLGDENSSQEMTLFMNALDRVSGREPAKVLITHDKKGSTQDKVDDDDDTGDLMEGNRGSTSVAGAVDTVIRLTPKGYMYYQGRAVGEVHKRLKFAHVHGEMGFMWQEDLDEPDEAARHLLLTYRQGSERSIARLLAKKCNLAEERARAIVRRERQRIGRRT